MNDIQELPNVLKNDLGLVNATSVKLFHLWMARYVSLRYAPSWLFQCEVSEIILKWHKIQLKKHNVYLKNNLSTTKRSVRLAKTQISLIKVFAVL